MRGIMFLIAVTVALAGCASLKRVDGNTINYGLDKIIVVDQAFENIGSFEIAYSDKLENSTKLSVAMTTVDIFVKKFKNTNEVVEVLSVHWTFTGNKVVWSPSIRGSKDDRFERIKNFRKEYMSQFSNAGLVMSRGFQCMESNRIIDDKVQKSIYYCVAESIIPSGADVKVYLKDKLTESVLAVQ